ncbi:MAF protein [Niveibacterium umoris]|uniref:7-methyl-GTP pyrophosphatase n=2 Tax=Niveibacterium umoris TaxID=1193620 RepID=A0A840BK09_9RHOO|nr:MAF protein [Niveibacterium umoris]
MKRQIKSKRLQATLTLHAGLGLDRHFKEVIITDHNPKHFELDRTLTIDQLVGQPRQRLQLDTSLQTLAALSKFKRIGNERHEEVVQLLRHKRAMILSFPFPVKGDVPCSNRPPAPMRKIILASTSRYRRELLEKLGLPFETDKPETDESPLPREAPASTAIRLAEEKARAVSSRHPDALIIGSDQVASVGDERFGKPGTAERAQAQLRQMSGRSITFHTAVCLLDTQSDKATTLCVPTEVGFRTLSDDEIERYVGREMPLDCAGSAKSEGLGIALLEHIRGDDPNALVGLPLIALSRLLRDAGVQVV